MKKIGRPPVPEKKVQVSVGATSEQKARWEAAAKREKRSLSQWVAIALDARLLTEPYDPDKDLLRRMRQKTP